MRICDHTHTSSSLSGSKSFEEDTHTQHTHAFLMYPRTHIHMYTLPPQSKAEQSSLWGMSWWERILRIHLLAKRLVCTRSGSVSLNSCQGHQGQAACICSWILRFCAVLCCAVMCVCVCVCVCVWEGEKVVCDVQSAEWRAVLFN